MARGVSKKGRSMAPVSRPLEEYFPINFKVLGTPEWIVNSFPAGCLSTREIILVKSKSDLDEPKSWLLAQKQLGVDSETTGIDKRSGLDPRNPTSRIVLLQIGTADQVYLIQPDLIPEFKGILESRDILHLLQNAVYDFKYLLTKYGIHIERMYDTMLAEQLLTSGLMGVSVGLEELCRKYFPHRIISKEIRKQFLEFNGVFNRRMIYYAARDIVLLPPIMQQQVEAIGRHKMNRVAQDEFDVIPCTAMMELGGVHMDVSVLRMALTYWSAREKELENQIIKMYDEEKGKQGGKALYLIPGMQEFFDLKSSSQKLEALRSIGLDISDTKRDTLEELDHPIAALLAEYSEVAKINSTYGENLIEKVSPLTNRLYPEFNQLGSGDLEARQGRVKKETIATGRYSSDFQQLPRAVARYARVNPQELEAVQALYGDVIAAKLAELNKGEVNV